MFPLNKFNFSGDSTFSVPPINALSSIEAREYVLSWMKNQLPCVAGRRETLKNRYMIEITTKDTLPQLFRKYQTKLKQKRAIACLFIFNDFEYFGFDKSVSDVFYYLADQVQKISRISSHSLANGNALTKTIELECPVTGQLTCYDDFEFIAFCPQSNNPDDILYDPLMAMPLPAVNLSSDMYAYSNFVSDMVNQRHGTTVRELSVDRKKTEQVLYHCVSQWQRIACKTIKNYETLTDTSLCPVHINNKEDKWIAGHKDPAFAEQIKEVHEHELPIRYAKRITEEWIEYFYNNKTFSASGLARDGQLNQSI